jgi:4-hydroxybenzoate polyprenyltransferase
MKLISDAGVKPSRLGLRAYLSCVRYPEVILLQGSPLLGMAFAIGDVTAEKLATAVVFAVASFLLVAHIWTFNDWAGLTTDSNDPNKAGHVFSTKGVSPRGLLSFSLGLFAASVLLFALLPHRTLVIAVAVAMLGVVYSHPALHAKSIPLASSVTHLLGGLSHFLLGYSLFEGVDRRGVLIGLFFALTFAAGHLNQEVRDHAGDELNALSTNAVYFGQRLAFLAGLVLFTLAYADLALLAYHRLVPPAVGALAAALYPVHLGASILTLYAGLEFGSVQRLQRVYRVLYALIGLSMLAALARSSI